MEKTCCTCKRVKVVTEFSKAHSSKDGLQDRCKQCGKDWYLLNKDAHQANVRKYKGSKPKDCSKCGFTHTTRYKLCPPCYHKSSKVPCPQCGESKSKASVLCKTCAQRGENNGNYKGGSKYVDSRGYVRTRISGRDAFEHVLVMEESLGRRLLKEENVHHINGLKHDNRIENLELWRRPQPSGIRVADAISWAKEVLNLYEPTALTSEHRSDILY